MYLPLCHEAHFLCSQEDIIRITTSRKQETQTKKAQETQFWRMGNRVMRQRTKYFINIPSYLALHIGILVTVQFALALSRHVQRQHTFTFKTITNNNVTMITRNMGIGAIIFCSFIKLVESNGFW
jgi:predicted sugar kinase